MSYASPENFQPKLEWVRTAQKITMTDSDGNVRSGILNKSTNKQHGFKWKPSLRPSAKATLTPNLRTIKEQKLQWVEDQRKQTTNLRDYPHDHEEVEKLTKQRIDEQGNPIKTVYVAISSDTTFTLRGTLGQVAPPKEAKYIKLKETA